ncbi:Putative uncharacterized protein Yba3 [Buchnera aphidicola (Periphyllus testudinaceus)]|uniref:hypothetical protein n=1 Tax=Buchnera aphidicola TaxID=9 RepID=UPI00346470CA
MMSILDFKKKNYMNLHNNLKFCSIKNNESIKKNILLEKNTFMNMNQLNSLFFKHLKKKMESSSLRSTVNVITNDKNYKKVHKNNVLENSSCMNKNFKKINKESTNKNFINNFLLSKNSSNNDVSNNISSIDSENKDEHSNDYYLKSIKNSLSEMSEITDQESDSDGLDIDSKHITWKVLIKVIHSKENIDLLSGFQDSFNDLKKTSNLSEDFDIEDPTSSFQFNSSPVYKNSKEEILKNLEKFFPNLEDRQLISNYANSDILIEARRAFLRRTSNIMNFSPIHSHINYLIDKLPDGNIQLIVIYLSDLAQIKYDSSEFYNTFGLRAKCILYKDKIPDVKYAYFVK